MDQNTSDHTAFLESKEKHYAAKRITLVGIGHELEEKKRKKKKKEILGHAGETVRASLFSLLHSFFCHEGEIGSERITISHRSRGFLLNLCREVQR